MASLPYLLITRFKNSLKQLLKSPGKLIFAIGIVLIIFLGVISGALMNGNPYQKFRDPSELSAGIVGLYTFFFLLITKNGFGNGAGMFSMSDVNLIFPSPISSRKVLFYGLFRQLSTSIIMGAFIIFQSSLLQNLYGIGFGGLLIILLGFCITILMAQVTSMVIYTLTSSSERKKTVGKMIFYSIFITFLLYAAFYSLTDQTHMAERLVRAANGIVIQLMPVSGWVGSAVSGMLFGDGLQIALGFSLTAGLLLALICFIVFYNPDFYEDVLKSAEITQSAITSRKEGQMKDIVPKNVKVGTTGLGKGFGANAFYYKHLLENRRSRVVLLLKNIAWIVGIIIYGVFTRELGLAAIFLFSTYMQAMMVALGRFKKELTKPYIYLVPEPPLQKLLYTLKEALPSTVLEAFFVFIPIAFIFRLNLVETVFCIVARVTFAFLFTAGNIVVERVWGGSSMKALMMMFYFLVLFLLLLPGGILSIILLVTNVTIVNTLITVLTAFIISNIPVSLLALFLCRNMLQYAELNQK